MPITKTQAKALARYLYFNTELTQKQIAEAAEVTEATMSAWVRRSNWRLKKMNTVYSPDQETNSLYEELRAINNIIKAREPGQQLSTKQELETRAKIITMIANLKKNFADKWRNVTPDVDYSVPVPYARKYDGFVIVRNSGGVRKKLNFK